MMRRRMDMMRMCTSLLIDCHGCLERPEEPGPLLLIIIIIHDSWISIERGRRTRFGRPVRIYNLIKIPRKLGCISSQPTRTSDFRWACLIIILLGKKSSRNQTEVTRLSIDSHHVAYQIHELELNEISCTKKWLNIKTNDAVEITTRLSQCICQWP